MTPELVAKKIWTGYGKAALHVGFPTAIYRPSGPTDPISNINLIATVPGAFALGQNFENPNRYGNATWRAMIDGNQIEYFDYLVSTNMNGSQTFFVAEKQPDLPIVTVLCNMTVNVKRPAQNDGTGLQGYGGNTLATETAIMTAWPASVLQGNKGRVEVKLPGDTYDPFWEILLPALSGVEIKSRDLIEEDVSASAPPTRFVVSGAELTELGWRIRAQQVLA